MSRYFDRSHRRARRMLVVLSVLAAGSACGPKVRHVRLGRFYPPHPPDATVAVFSANIPDCAFDEIAIVTRSENPPFSGAAAALEALKAEARRMGGHALVGLRPGEEPSDVLGSITYWSATVVRFPDPSCQRDMR